MAVLTLFLGACAMEVESDDDVTLDELEAGVGANLVANPGFQIGPGEGGTVRCPDPDYFKCFASGHWGIHGAGALRSQYWGRFHEDGESSNWGLEISKNSEGEFATQTVAAAPGRYRLRIFAEAHHSNDYSYDGSVGVGFYGDNGELTGGDFMDLSSNDGGEWRKYFADVSAGPGTKSARVVIWLVSSEAPMGFDDVVLAPLHDN